MRIRALDTAGITLDTTTTVNPDWQMYTTSPRTASNYYNAAQITSNK